MKKLTFIIPLFFSLTGFAQSATKTLDNLIATTKEGLRQAQEVVYDNQAHSLKVGNWIIPLSQNTLTKVESENGQYEVEFSLQKGTAVTSATDANWKRASFALSLKSQELAEKFSSLFHELTEKGNDN